MTRRFVRWLALLFAVMAGAGGVLLRGQAPPQQPPTFRGSIDAVQLSVIVTDREGNPVSGLTEDDFEILEDGKARPITTFAAVNIPIERTERTLVEKDVLSNDGPPGRLYVIALDQMAGDSALRTRAFLRRFIEEYFGPNDTAAVVLTTRGVRESGQEFTSNPRLLLTAIDRFDGGSGINTLSYANDTAGVTVNLLSGTIAGGDATGDTIVFGSIQNLIGGSGNDSLRGNAGNNRIDGGAGDDTIGGNFGNDILIGGANGASGDRLDFGIGTLTSGVTVNLSITTAQDTGAGIKTILGFENISGSDFDDVFTGNSDVNSIGGSDGNDIIKGGAGADLLDGGNNTAGGGDWVTYAGSASGVTVNVNGGIQHGGDAEGDNLFGFENVIGSSFADTLTGSNDNNGFEGGLGADIINGGISGAFGDTVVYQHSAAGVTVDLTLATAQISAGEASGDLLSNIENILGSDHADTLTGTSGGNFLLGGLGADILTGGAGADLFFFKDFAEGGDHLTDFESGSDKIAVGFTTGLANLDSGSDPTAGSADAWFLYDTDDGKLYFDADGNGAGAQVLFVTLDGAPPLAATDFDTV